MKLTRLQLDAVDLVLDQPVLDQITVTFESGIHCLLGPNGAGKTMTNRVVALIEAVSGGEVRWDGEVINPFSSDRLEYIRSIGYMRQQPVFLNRSVRNNTAIPLQFRELDGEVIRVRVDDMLREFNLEEFADRSISKLSKGQQQKVALARTLITNPDLIILDEPTASLDMATTKWFEQYIQNLPADKVIIWTTHDQFQVRRVATNVSVFLGGQLCDSGATVKILDHSDDDRVNRYLAGELL